MKRILVAHPSVDIFELIKDSLDASYVEPAPQVVFSKNHAEVIALCGTEKLDLVVTYLDLSADRQSSPQKGQGLALIRELKESYPSLPCILIAPSATEALARELQTIRGLMDPRSEYFAMVTEGSRLEQDLLVQMRNVLDKPAVEAIVVPGEATRVGTRRRAGARRKDATRFVIDMRLRMDGHCSYGAESIDGPLRFRNTRFEVDPEVLQELIAQSKALQEAEHWSRDYLELGKKLREVLLTSNLQVFADIIEMRTLMRATDPNKWPTIRFTVEAGIHAIALESLVDERDDYWMLRAPIVRQIEVRRGSYPIYQDPSGREKALNCLIIESDAIGDAFGLQFKGLPSIRSEVERLTTHLKDQSHTRIAKIGRIWKDETGHMQVEVRQGSHPVKRTPHAGSYRMALRELLTGTTAWDIVHYVGHSHYDAANDRGYLLLPGTPIESIGASELANWMSQTRFVYMSSCRGSSKDFVFNLCKCNVPAVAGFRYPVEDATAAHHSETFYNELLAGRSLEGALFKTWNHMYGLYPKDRIWTSTELTVQ